MIDKLVGHDNLFYSTVIILLMQKTEHIIYLIKLWYVRGQIYRQIYCTNGSENFN